MLFILLLIFSSLATARLLPLAPRLSLSYANSNLQDKCTFTLWHRQQSFVDYVRLDTIIDHANNLTVDVASFRPGTAFNSYTRLDREHAFAVAGLLDDARLTVMYGGNDVLKFQIEEVKWSTGEAYVKHVKDGERVEAWCDGPGWEGRVDRRERRLDCAFPCEEATGEDLQREDDGWAHEGESQARIGLA